MSKIKRIDLLGGNSVWMKPETKVNINKVFKFLKSNVSATKKGFSISEISRGTGIHRQQVSSAVQIMAFMPQNRVVRLEAVYRQSKNNPGIRSRVVWIGDLA